MASTANSASAANQAATANGPTAANSVTILEQGRVGGIGDIGRGAGKPAAGGGGGGAAQVTRESDLAHWWKMDEGTGSTAADSVGDADMTLSSATWESTTVRGGSAIDFDGTDDYLIGSLGDVSILSNYTITAWVYWNAVSGWRTIWNLTYSTTDTHFSQLMSVSGSQTFTNYHKKANISNVYVHVTDYEDGDSGAGFVTGKWYHYATVWDGTAQTQKVYVNAVQIGSTTSGVDGWYESGGGVGLQPRMGMYSSPGTSWRVNGIMDDFRIYNAALSASDVGDIYGSGDGDF